MAVEPGLPEPKDERARRIRGRNRALLAVLVGLVALFYVDGDRSHRGMAVAMTWEPLRRTAIPATVVQASSRWWWAWSGWPSRRCRPIGCSAPRPGLAARRSGLIGLRPGGVAGDLMTVRFNAKIAPKSPGNSAPRCLRSRCIRRAGRGIFPRRQQKPWTDHRHRHLQVTPPKAASISTSSSASALPNSSRRRANRATWGSCFLSIPIS